MLLGVTGAETILWKEKQEPVPRQVCPAPSSGRRCRFREMKCAPPRERRNLSFDLEGGEEKEGSVSGERGS